MMIRPLSYLAFRAVRGVVCRLAAGGARSLRPRVISGFTARPKERWFRDLVDGTWRAAAGRGRGRGMRVGGEGGRNPLFELTEVEQEIAGAWRRWKEEQIRRMTGMAPVPSARTTKWRRVVDHRAEFVERGESSLPEGVERVLFGRERRTPDLIGQGMQQTRDRLAGLRDFLGARPGNLSDEVLDGIAERLHLLSASVGWFEGVGMERHGVVWPDVKGLKDELFAIWRQVADRRGARDQHFLRHLSEVSLL